jgi:hypothetical protein
MNQASIRISGVLLLIVFVIGVINYQFLRGPLVFDDNYLSLVANHQSKIILSVLLSFFSGILSIVVSLALFEYFRKGSLVLALAYIAFTLVNFMGIMVENIAAFSVLEVSQAYIENTAFRESSASVLFETTFYGIHKWAHYSFLLLSCTPVFVLFYGLFKFRFIPRLISVFGMIAVVLMFVDVILLMLEIKIPIDLLLPIGLVQLLLPVWLIIKGFKLQNSTA